MYARGDAWATFQPQDSDKLEKRWNKLAGESNDHSPRKQRLNRDAKQPANSSAPHAPPSGVDAIHTALAGFEDPSSEHKPNSDSASSKCETSSSPWLNGLRSYLPFANNQPRSDRNDNSRDRSVDSESSSDRDDNKSESEKSQVNLVLDPDEPESDRAATVEVMEDNLFDVDLESMTLYPVFWKGVLLKVVRATWFYSSLTDGSYVPISCDDPLSKDLDHAYEQAQPWLHATDLDTEASKHQAADTAEETERARLYPLPSMKDQGQVSFQDAQVGRIFSQDLRGRFLSVLGGAVVVRGFDRAEQIAEQRSFSPFSNLSLPWANDNEKDGTSNANGSSKYTQAQQEGTSIGARSASKRQGAARAGSSPPSGGGADGPNRARSSTNGDEDERRSFAAKLVPSSDAALRPFVALKRFFGYDQNEAADEGKRQVKQDMTHDELDRQKRSENDPDLLPDDRKDEPPELVFAIHGIGQSLVEDFEALDFVYDVEHLRNLATENARDPAVRRLSRGRRVQFLPICWRRFVAFDDEPEDNDNFYTLDDITNSAAIPVIRNIITKVVLDVPFYLSRHRKKMIDSVISELNRTYRLFCRRNPDFEKNGGRVSLIGHSLGSALAADILSAQPSVVPPLLEVEQSDHEALRRNDRLHFNVKNLFFIGSPVAFFFHLDGGQLIARSGTQRHPEDTSDAFDTRKDRYGCLAAENVYNVFNPNDPVAFQLAPTVDSAYAKLIKPIAIESATEALLRTLSLPRMSVSRIFEKYKEHPFQAVGKIGRQARILADDPDALPAGLSPEEKQRVTSRKKGERIVDSSDYIKTIRKWHHLQNASPTPSDFGAATPEARELETEKGTRKKTLQPETALRTSSIPEDEADDKHDFDLDSLERAERRFRALNPHGCIDYHLSETISLSSYIDALGAHLCYWTHRDFAVFVLTQLFMDFTKQDELTIVPELQGAGGEGDGEESQDDEGTDEDDTDEGDDEE
ncbi:hypothetical protein PHSY_006410 [Pseudozyma hubeiensis SY62]|uniref:DDHD domain-containing protein n=1 Tax=Pseudozyma hubeiensis (strain SY62) TaxID=1305764 RepID=R9PL66_PSEHS|nr:hypothetical protein PHSY_006410 [Pseudozyma hubeiensis SY62]GAC98815.1 hypothetical protein PHSY_006410 [Pseudozyma hubeiensis SY62]